MRFVADIAVDDSDPNEGDGPPDPPRKMWHDDTDWYVAADRKELRRLVEEDRGEWSYEDDSWSEFTTDFRMYCADKADLPPGMTFEAEEGEDGPVEKTSGYTDSWPIAVWLGLPTTKPGFFASTEF